MSANEVRIIGGQWRGRKLKFPDVPGLRPTLGRVRGTLFNWLVHDIRGACCLDLFAGSGALGFEALSRGAASVTLVEQNRKVARALERNAALLQTDNAVVRCESAQRFLTHSSTRWDIVFFDPPFFDTDAGRLLDTLLAHLSGKRALIYVERSVHEPMPLESRLVKRGRAGEVQFGLLESP